MVPVCRHDVKGCFGTGGADNRVAWGTFDGGRRTAGTVRRDFEGGIRAHKEHSAEGGVTVESHVK